MLGLLPRSFPHAKESSFEINYALDQHLCGFRPALRRDHFVPAIRISLRCRQITNVTIGESDDKRFMRRGLLES